MRPAKLNCITQKTVTLVSESSFPGAAIVRKLVVKVLLVFSQHSHFPSSSKKGFHADWTLVMTTAKGFFEQQPLYVCLSINKWKADTYRELQWWWHSSEGYCSASVSILPVSPKATCPVETLYPRCSAPTAMKSQIYNSTLVYIR